MSPAGSLGMLSIKRAFHLDPSIRSGTFLHRRRAGKSDLDHEIRDFFQD